MKKNVFECLPFEVVFTDSSEQGMQKMKSAIILPQAFTDECVKKNNLREKLNLMFSKTIRNDLMLLLIEGDTSIKAGDGQTREKNLLCLLDGFGALAKDCETSCNNSLEYGEFLLEVPKQGFEILPNDFFGPSPSPDKGLVVNMRNISVRLFIDNADTSTKENGDTIYEQYWWVSLDLKDTPKNTFRWVQDN